MSAVEVAIDKIKKLSPSEVRQLLFWLDARSVANRAAKPSRRRKASRSKTMAELKAWRKSIRLSTDWEPPRMPGDFIKPFSL
jgi:hypothetical protein